MVAEGGNLVADTLKGVAVPTSVDNKATCNGIALGLIADKFDVHIFRVLVISCSPLAHEILLILLLSSFARCTP
jgi:hypothetical protein